MTRPASQWSQIGAAIHLNSIYSLHSAFYAVLADSRSLHSLYRAPVESDIKAKVAKDPPTRARSTIRRTARRAVNDPSSTPSARFYARRHDRASHGDETPWSPWDHAGSAEASAPLRSNAPTRTGLRRAASLLNPASTSLEHAESLHRSSRPSDSALREVVSRNGSGMSQDLARYFGEHMAMLHAATSSRPAQTMENPSEGDETEPFSSDPWGIASRDLPTPPRQVSDYYYRGDSFLDSSSCLFLYRSYRDAAPSLPKEHTSYPRMISAPSAPRNLHSS